MLSPMSPIRPRSCYGLLHEFAGERSEEDVERVMGEIGRILCAGGLLVLTVFSGDPEAGLPAVQMFTRQMFEDATEGFREIHVEEFDDVGCTGRTDYHVWYGMFEKSGVCRW